MIIGVKYCGGCNIRYDRKKFLESLKKEFSSLEFHNAQPNIKYDVLLVLSGCFSGCADYSKLEYKNIIDVKEESDYEQVIETLNNLLS